MKSTFFILYESKKIENIIKEQLTPEQLQLLENQGNSGINLQNQKRINFFIGMIKKPNIQHKFEQLYYY